MLTKAAGGIVMGTQGKVIVVSQNNDSWSLPKGHLEENETELQSAVREIREETGVSQLELVRKLGEYERFQIGKGGIGENINRQKHITIYLFTTSQQKLKPLDPDNPIAKWVDIEEVESLLTHPKDKEFFVHVKPEVLQLLRELA